MGCAGLDGQADLGKPGCTARSGAVAAAGASARGGGDGSGAENKGPLKKNPRDGSPTGDGAAAASSTSWSAVASGTHGIADRSGSAVSSRADAWAGSSDVSAAAAAALAGETLKASST